MNIFTYFEPVPGMDIESQTKVISLWRKNWGSQGWRAFVINERHARSHPLYREFRSVVMEFPSINPKGYDYHCFLRWLAFSQCCNGDRAVMSDYDVMSYGFEPSVTEDSRLQLYQGHVPALVMGYRKSVDDLLKLFMDYKIVPTDTEGGRPHLSDMHILQRLLSSHPKRFNVDLKACCYQEDGWQTLPAVHFSNCSMAAHGKQPKWKFIPELRKPFPQ